MKRLPRETTVVVTEVPETVPRRKQHSSGPALKKQTSEGKTALPVVSAASDINSSHVGCHYVDSRRDFNHVPLRYCFNSSRAVPCNPALSQGDNGSGSGSCLMMTCSSSSPRSWHISRTCTSQPARTQSQASGRELSMTHCIDELRSLIRVTVSDPLEHQTSQSAGPGASLDPKEIRKVRFFEEQDLGCKLNNDSHKMGYVKEESPDIVNSRNIDLDKSPENSETPSPNIRHGSLKGGRIGRGMKGQIRSGNQEEGCPGPARLATRWTSLAPARNGGGCWQLQDRHSDPEIVQNNMGLVKTASCRQKMNDDSNATWKVVGSSVKKVSRQIERHPNRKCAWVETEKIGHRETPTVANGWVNCAEEHAQREDACGGQWKMWEGCVNEASCSCGRQKDNRQSRRYIHTLSSGPTMCQMTNLTSRSVMRNFHNEGQKPTIRRVCACSDASFKSGNQTIQKSSPKSSLWEGNRTSALQIRCKMDTASPRDIMAQISRGSQGENRATSGRHVRKQEVQKVFRLEPTRTSDITFDCSVPRCARRNARSRSFRYLNNNKNSSCWSFEYLAEAPDDAYGQDKIGHSMVSDLNDDDHFHEFQITEMSTVTCLSQSINYNKHGGEQNGSNDDLNQNGCCSNQTRQIKDTRTHRKARTTNASPSRPTKGEQRRFLVSCSLSHREVNEKPSFDQKQHSLHSRPNVSDGQSSHLDQLAGKSHCVQKRHRISEAMSNSNSYSLTCSSRKLSDEPSQGEGRSTGLSPTVLSLVSEDNSTRAVCSGIDLRGILAQERRNTHTKMNRLILSPKQADGWLTARNNYVKHRQLPVYNDGHWAQDNDCSQVKDTRSRYQDNSCYSSTLDITTPNSYIHETDCSGNKRHFDLLEDSYFNNERHYKRSSDRPWQSNSSGSVADVGYQSYKGGPCEDVFLTRYTAELYSPQSSLAEERMKNYKRWTHSCSGANGDHHGISEEKKSGCRNKKCHAKTGAVLRRGVDKARMSNSTASTTGVLKTNRTLPQNTRTRTKGCSRRNLTCPSPREKRSPPSIALDAEHVSYMQMVPKCGSSRAFRVVPLQNKPTRCVRPTAAQRRTVNSDGRKIQSKPERWEVCRSSKFYDSTSVSQPSSKVQTMCSDSAFQTSAYHQGKHFNNFVSLPVNLKSKSAHSSSRPTHPLEPADCRPLDIQTGQSSGVSFSDLPYTVEARHQKSDAESSSLDSEPFLIRFDHGEFSSRSPEFLHVPKGSKNSYDDFNTDSSKDSSLSTAKEALNSGFSTTEVILRDSTYLKNRAGTQTDSFCKMACDSFRLDSLGSARLRDMDVSGFTLSGDVSGFTHESSPDNISGNLCLNDDKEVSRALARGSRRPIFGSTHCARKHAPSSIPSGDTCDVSPDYWSQHKVSGATMEGSTCIYCYSHSPVSYENETNTLGQDVRINHYFLGPKQNSRRNKKRFRLSPDTCNIFSLEESGISYDSRGQKARQSTPITRSNSVPGTSLVYSERGPHLGTQQNLPDLLTNGTHPPGTAVGDDSTTTVTRRCCCPADSFRKIEKRYSEVKRYDNDTHDCVGLRKTIGLQQQRDITVNYQCDTNRRKDLSVLDDGEQPRDKSPRATVCTLPRSKEIKKPPVQTNTGLPNHGKHTEKKTVSPSARHGYVGKGQTFRQPSWTEKLGLVENGETPDTCQDSRPRQAKTYTAASRRDTFLDANENKLQTVACVQLTSPAQLSVATEQSKSLAHSMAKFPEKKFDRRKDVPTEAVSGGDEQKAVVLDRQGDHSVSTLHQGSRVKTASVTQKQKLSQTGNVPPSKRTPTTPCTPNRPSSILSRTSSQTPKKPQSLLLRTSSQTTNKPLSALMRTSPQTTNKPLSALMRTSPQTTNKPSMVQPRTSPKIPKNPSSVLPRRSPQTPKKTQGVLSRVSPQMHKRSPTSLKTSPMTPNKPALTKSYTSPQTSNKLSSIQTCTPNQTPNKSSFGHRGILHQSATDSKQTISVFTKQHSINENPQPSSQNPHSSKKNSESSNSHFCQALLKKVITSQGTQETITAREIPTSTCPKSVASSPGNGYLERGLRQIPAATAKQKSSSQVHRGSRVDAENMTILDKKATQKLSTFEVLQQTPLKVVKTPNDYLSDVTFTLDKTASHSLGERRSPDCLSSRSHDGISPEFQVNEDVNPKWKFDNKIQTGGNAKDPNKNMRLIRKGFTKGNLNPQSEFRGSKKYLTAVGRVKSGSRMIQAAPETSTHQYRGSRLIQSTHGTRNSHIRKPSPRQRHNDNIRSNPPTTPHISPGPERETSDCESHACDMYGSVPGDARSYQDQTALFEYSLQKVTLLTECSEKPQQRRSQCSDGVSSPSRWNEHRNHPFVTDSNFRNQARKENTNLTFQDWAINQQSDGFSFRMKTEDEASDRSSFEEDVGSCQKFDIMKFPQSKRTGYFDDMNYIEGSNKTGAWSDEASFNLGSTHSDTPISHTVPVTYTGTPDPRGGCRQQHVPQEHCRQGRTASGDNRRYPSLWPAEKTVVTEANSSRGTTDFLSPSRSDDQSTVKYQEGKEFLDRSAEASEGSQLSSLSWAHLAITDTTFS